MKYNYKFSHDLRKVVIMVIILDMMQVEDGKLHSHFEWLKRSHQEVMYYVCLLQTSGGGSRVSERGG